mgnify:CR=1 FL=1
MTRKVISPIEIVPKKNEITKISSPRALAFNESIEEDKKIDEINV